MGTGGNKNTDRFAIARVVEHLDRSMYITCFETGRVGDQPEKFRNTQQPGVYLLKYAGTEFEVTFRVKKQIKNDSRT